MSGREKFVSFPPKDEVGKLRGTQQPAAHSAKRLFECKQPCSDNPCARSEMRPRNEVSFRLPGNICFFALMGRKRDAEVEFTCCHSQKCAKVGFLKGFLFDLIGPDRVVDMCCGQPARRCRQDETMVISGETM